MEHELEWKIRAGLIMRLGAAALACVLTFGGCEELKEIEALTIEDVDPSAVRDGDYEGFQDNKLVTARAVVSVRGGRIAGLRLTEHGHGPKHGAEAILDRVMEKQSLKVDAVSGSTSSSKVVLKAIETALRKGL